MSRRKGTETEFSIGRLIAWNPSPVLSTYLTLKSQQSNSKTSLTLCISVVSIGKVCTEA